MRIVTKKRIDDFTKDYPDAKTALEDWHSKTKDAEWDNFADIKKTFNSVDSVGNGRFVFNIKGNSYPKPALLPEDNSSCPVLFACSIHARSSKENTIRWLVLIIQGCHTIMCV